MPEGTTIKKTEDIMRLNIYSIYDTAAGLYSRPFFTASDAQASREFSDLATDKNHPVGMHPEDYSLFRVGLWDDNKALLTNEANECLATALELVAAARPLDSVQTELPLQKVN